MTYHYIYICIYIYIWLGNNNFFQIGTVAHEIGHALGMFHEQSRSDRDMYVEVIPENIEPGYEHNFDLTSTNNYNTPYNFYSMMHYKKTVSIQPCFFSGKSYH